MAAVNTFLRAFLEMPPVTRVYVAASVATTLAVQLELISPFQLYFNPKLIFNSHQYWRLVTSFLYFGTLGFNFLFNLVFTYRYCRMLEEEFFMNRTADFFYMFLVGGTLMSMLAYFVNLLFLGHAFTIMLVYIWSRRNPTVRMNFFGLITFQAPYLPWVLLGFSILLSSSTVVDIIGIIVGHFYYFFEDVFPEEPHGFRILETPRIIKNVFLRLGIDEEPLPEHFRPENFNFGQNEARPNTDRPEAQPQTPQENVAPTENTNHSEPNLTSLETATTSQPTVQNIDSSIRDRERNQASDQELRARNVSEAG